MSKCQELLLLQVIVCLFKEANKLNSFEMGIFRYCDKINRTAIVSSISVCIHILLQQLILS
jgi:hypothetical protein